MKNPSSKIKIILFALIVAMGFYGCKDAAPDTEAAYLEACKISMDTSEWADAITNCELVGNDEGYHLAAQAYMGRAGLSLLSVLSTMTSATADSSSLMFDNVPDTAQDYLDYKSALNHLNENITTKSATVYLESLLISSMLVFYELKTLLTLTSTNGTITTCAGTTNDITGCTFAPSIGTYTYTYLSATYDIPNAVIFPGIGSDFYTNLCGAAETSTDTYTTVDATGDDPSSDNDLVITLTYDVTVDSCTIAPGSVLYYNKIAAANVSSFGGLTGLDALDFYSNMDIGTNFSINLDATTVSFCVTGIITPPTSSDNELNDCEILSYLSNPGF